METKLELSEYTEDQSEELLFANRKRLCGDLGLQLHTLRKVPNLLKVLRHHVNKDITIYPFINSVKDLLFEQGSTNNKQDTWELSYRSIVYILFHYGIELERVTNEQVDVVVTVNPVDKLKQTIAKNKEEIDDLEIRLRELRYKKNDIQYEITDIEDELYELRKERDKNINLLTQLEQLL